MVMKPIRKCRRKEAKSLTLPTVAEGSFWPALWFGKVKALKQAVSHGEAQNLFVVFPPSARLTT